MRSIAAVDIDLADPASTLPTADADAHVLVWWRHHVLGTVVVKDLSRPWAVLREGLREPFSDRITMIERLRTDGMTETIGDTSRLCVVVCTRDRPDQLHDCLLALGRLDPPPGDLVVVDNAPSDTRTADLCREFAVRRVVETRPGLSHARNAGIRATTHDLIAFTDDDARPHHGWAARLTDGFFAPEIDIVTGLIVADELLTTSQRRFERNGGMHKGFVPTIHTATSGIGVNAHRLGAGANMAFRRSALDRIGGFDTRLGPGRPTRGADDLDAFVRVLDSGGTAFYEPDAVVRHVHRTTMTGLWRQYRDNGVAFAALLAKYETESATLGDVARRERRRRLTGRYGAEVIRAARRNDRIRLFEIVAEFVGSRDGARAFAEETTASCC